MAEQIETKAAKAINCLERGLEDALAVMALPGKYRKRLKSTNMQKRLIQEVRRRERVIRIFPDEGSALRLMGVLPAEIHEEWQGRRYPGVPGRVESRFHISVIAQAQIGPSYRVPCPVSRQKVLVGQSLIRSPYRVLCDWRSISIANNSREAYTGNTVGRMGGVPPQSKVVPNQVNKTRRQGQ